MAAWIANENLTHDGKSAGSWAVWTNEPRPRYVGEFPRRDDALVAASAPALLAALESIVAACEGITANGHNCGDGWIAAHEKFGAFARAAIAAARGEG